MRRYIILFFLLCGGAGVAVLLLNPYGPKQRRYFDESTGFRQIGQFAGEMVRDGGEGILVTEDGQPYIESFDAFVEYVRSKHLDVVVDRNAANPFPDLLPEARYGRLSGRAIGPDELLFWSETIHEKNAGDVRMRLTCGGLVRNLLKSGDKTSSSANSPE